VLRSSHYTGSGTATLSAQTPLAEQLISLRINAAALPAAVPTSAELYVFAADDAAPAEASQDPAEVDAPPLVVPVVMIIREDTGEVMSSTVTWSGQARRERNVYAVIPIDCSVGADCERRYRVRVAAPSLAAGQTVSASWLTQARLDYEGVDSGCGVPSGARAEVEVDSPHMVAASDSGFGTTVPITERAAHLVARHITVTSEGGRPSAAAVRISTVEVNPGNDAAEWNPWYHQWVRVVPDGSTAPVADDLVFKLPSGAEPLPGGTLDVPVLDGCPPGEPCTRGYWVIFQNFPYAPESRFAPARSIQDPGPFAWTAAATASFADTGDMPASISVRVDDRDSGLPSDVTVRAKAPPVVLTSNKTPTALDVTITVPARPRPENGIDALAASGVVVNVSGSGVALTTEVQGGGPGPLTGYFNGDGSTNLIAHPFDSCPATGPCTVNLRLVGTFHVEQTGSQRESAELAWAVELVGVPADTTVAFGDLRELSGSAMDPTGFLVPGVAGLVLVGLALLAWKRRRA
jgi:hypothetical protein